MSIHKEGYKIILTAFLIFAVVNFAIIYFSSVKFVSYFLLLASLVFFGLIVWFFRDPQRKVIPDEKTIYSPADGKVVVIEKVFDKEYFNKEMLQISVFMSPLNVHVNYYPVEGIIRHTKYYPGKYLVAWHPKSSELNERSVVVIEDNKKREVFVKQIAGAVARRIVTYSKVNESVKQGDELGFIKFGSRVDLLLPVDTKINVKLGDKVQGNKSVIGTFE